jgi:hypothetical protein
LVRREYVGEGAASLDGLEISLDEVWAERHIGEQRLPGWGLVGVGELDEDLFHAP